MKHIIILIASMYIYTITFGQEATVSDKIIYGSCSVKELTQSPYNVWWDKGYKDYTADVQTINKLKKLDLKNITVDIFFGSWCGDSKRELPRFGKILSAMNFPEKNFSLIALGGSDSLYKQSPAGEEVDKGIFRVPVFIVYKNGKEIGRINEYPTESLERDLLKIVSGEAHTPNYSCFYAINNWLKAGTLLDKNVNEHGLANTIRGNVENEYILNSLARLLIKQSKKQEALRLYKVNYWLYPESAIGLAYMGVSLATEGDKETGLRYIRYALNINKKLQDQEAILSALHEVEELEIPK